MKKILGLIIAVTLFFSLDSSIMGLTAEDFLQEQRELSGVEQIEDSLPNAAKEFLNDNDIKAGENEWVGEIGVDKVFSLIFDTAKKKITTPFSLSTLILAVVLISGVLNSHQSSISDSTAAFAVTAVSAAIITTPLISVINSAVEVLQSLSVFMTAFVSVFAVILASNGQTATSVSMSGLLLGATQIVEIVANHFVIPLMCGYLSVSIASGVSPLLAKTNLNESLKKISFWIMSLVTTVFLGVLSIQTTISASADSLTIRTARFVIGSSVPVAGTVLSEALTTVTASLGVLKTSVAIYGVVACCVIFLPLLIELILWRLCLNVTSIVAQVLSSENICRLLKCVDTAVSVLCGIILLSMALFVISLSVVVSVGRL